jgi:hypothetical protein
LESQILFHKPSRDRLSIRHKIDDLETQRSLGAYGTAYSELLLQPHYLGVFRKDS